MKRLHILSFIFFALGIILLIVSGLQGELKAGILFVFPFIIGSGLYSLAGFLFLILAFFLFALGFSQRTYVSEPTRSPQENKGRKPAVKGGRVVLVGPIPIVIGSSWKITLALIIAAIVQTLLVFFLFYFSV